MLDAERVIALLGLEPLPVEGGYFAETYRARERTRDGARTLATAIYYLVTPQSCSAMHRVASDELFHFYAGDPVELLVLEAGSGGGLVKLGTDLEAGERPQALVPAGAWQGARLARGGRWALLGTTVAPGFEIDDFEAGDVEALVRAWPKFEEEIRGRSR
jgi:hypothetical protein